MGRDGLRDPMELQAASKHFFFPSSFPCAQLVWLSANLSRLWRCDRVLGRVMVLVVSDDTRLGGRVMWLSERQSVVRWCGEEILDQRVEWRHRVAWAEVTRPRGRVDGKNGSKVTRPGCRVFCWMYSTWGSSMSSGSGLLLSICPQTAPNHLKITQKCNMYAKLS